VGEELHILDRAEGTITALDILPGTGSGAGWGDAVFANGRIFFQASADGTAASMRLYTTTDGTDLTTVTSPQLVDPGYQFPWLPEVIGDKVYFLAASNGTFGSNSWGVFEINSDGLPGTADDTTATLISPLDFGFIYGLEAIGGDLYFTEFEGSANQVWRMTPGGAPEQLTFFADEFRGIDSYFLGGDGRIYFARDTYSLGLELWVLDDSVAEGARLVADLNTGFEDAGYQPEQLVAVPDALDELRMQQAWYGSGEGGGGIFT
jgi:ELWxxDGT repeat protein